MPNMSLKKNEMPSQAPDVRNKNFLEVALGYTEEQALDEAQRCLHSKNKPCVAGCPVGIHIPVFIAKVAEGDFEGAYQIITQQSSLPAVCGRVCPQETQCEQKCVRGIKGEPVGIGRLERFVADWHNKNVCEAPRKPTPNGHKVAVIGSGPSGLTCAGDLAKKGYAVTVFEALHTAGGVLVYGIPEFRLPKDIVQKEIDGLKALGVDDRCELIDVSDFKYGDFTRLYKKVSGKMWANAVAARKAAERFGLNTLWYAKQQQPSSLREQYRDGYWLQFYIYKDLENLFMRENDSAMLEKLQAAYFSSDWARLSR